MTAVVVNRSMRSLRGGQLALEFGGRPLPSKPLDVEANSSASVTFDPVTVGRNIHARHASEPATMPLPPTTSFTSWCRPFSRFASSSSIAAATAAERCI